MNVVFVSNGDHYAWEAYYFLISQPCKAHPCRVVLSSLENVKIHQFPEDYDLGISFLYGHKIPKKELKRPWINMHPAPLPEYRGRNVAYHAIMNKAERFGATIHYMSEEFDTGDIIEVSRFNVLPGDTAGDLGHKSRCALLALFKKYIPLLLQGMPVEGMRQEECFGVYYYGNKIDEVVSLTEEQNTLIRALTYDPQFHAKLNIGGKLYAITPINTGGG